MPRPVEMLNARFLVAMAATALAGCGGDSDEPVAAPPPPPPVARPTAVEVKPGPTLLHEAAPRAPQLENAGVWQAPPILISGVSAYRNGEFLYQDYLYDDLGTGAYTYPTNNEAFRRNAADIVEFRAKPLDSELAIRITYNTMTDPNLIGTSIALGTSTAPRAFPHGANAQAPAQVFVTTWGTTGDVINAANGQVIGTPGVSVNLERRQVDIRIPYAYFDPRGMRNVRVAAGVGLWNAAANVYLIPAATATATQPGGAGTLTSPPAFFNVAFRYLQSSGGDFRTGTQATALRTGDISSFAGGIDFVKLVSGSDDDLIDTPVGAPSNGWINRIFASKFEPSQGKILTGSRDNACAVARPCDPTYAGQLQPYSVYLPTKKAPASGYGVTLDLHHNSGSHNSYSGPSSATPTRQIAFGERGTGSLVVSPLGRSNDSWYYGFGLADVFEVLADVRRQYKVDMTNLTSTGNSMGGYGTYKVGAMFPDLFAALAPAIGCPSAGVAMRSPTVYPGGADSAVLPKLDSLRNLPTFSSVGSADTLCSYANGQRAIGDRLKALEYPFEFRVYEGMGHVFAPSYQDHADYMGTRKVVVDPSHITYVRDMHSDEPALGVVADHVYWVSGITLRDSAASPRGTIDVISRGTASGEPTPQALVTGSGQLTANFFPYMFERREVVQTTQTRQNQLDIKATNISAIVIDGTRAGVDCSATLNVVSDGPLAVKIAGCP